MQFELNIKYTEIVYGTLLGHHNYTLCTRTYTITFPNRNRRFTGFCYTNGNMIIQLETCQLEEDEVFHFHVKICDKKTKEFIWQPPNLLFWELPNPWKVTNLIFVSMILKHLLSLSVILTIIYTSYIEYT